MPAHYRATGQSLFNGLSGSLGLVIEANIFGVLLDRIGAWEMFAVAAAIGSLSTVLLALTIPTQGASEHGTDTTAAEP